MRDSFTLANVWFKAKLCYFCISAMGQIQYCSLAGNGPMALIKKTFVAELFILNFFSHGYALGQLSGYSFSKVLVARKPFSILKFFMLSTSDGLS